MLIDTVRIIGAGGHAAVVIDTLRSTNDVIEIMVEDRNADLHGKQIEGITIEKPMISWDQYVMPVHVAVGDNHIRMKIIELLKQHHSSLLNAVHEKAIIASSAVLDKGIFVAAAAIVAPRVKVGMSCIINHHAVIDHDCVIADYCHIASNVTLGGSVSVGRASLIGSGAVVLPGIYIGDDCVVGAGAVVTKNVPNGAVVMGVPATIRHYVAD